MVLNEEESKVMMDELVNITNPSDEIVIAIDAARTLRNLWASEDRTEYGCPSDIFYANTIPMQDCIIRLNDSDNGSFRIVSRNEQKSSVKGHLVYEIKDGVNTIRFIYPFKTSKDNHRVQLAADYGLLTNGNRDKAIEISDGYPTQLASYILGVWYGIQISLLNPTINVVFQNGKKKKYNGECGGNKKVENKKGRRKAHYIKRHEIHSSDIDDALSDHDGFTRKTLCWYVVGHWREYKTGKKTFVHPYWKGPLRDAKKNLDDIRERVV